MSSSQNLSVERVILGRIVVDRRNPRRHSERQVKQIARSIQTFGFNVPVLIDRENNLIAGHGRLLASQALGLSEIPAIRIEHLSSAQATAFKVADNRLAEISDWDDQKLGEILQGLARLDLDFSIEATGFEMGEIEFRIESLDNKADNSEDKADNLPSTLGPPTTRPGDIWLLGNHRICCGSALDLQAYEKLMGSDQAELVFTDPL